MYCKESGKNCSKPNKSQGGKTYRFQVIQEEVSYANIEVVAANESEARKLVEDMEADLEFKGGEVTYKEVILKIRR